MLFLKSNKHILFFHRSDLHDKMLPINLFSGQAASGHPTRLNFTGTIWAIKRWTIIAFISSSCDLHPHKIFWDLGVQMIKKFPLSEYLRSGWKAMSVERRKKERAKVSVNNGQLCLQTPPWVEHANCQNAIKSYKGQNYCIVCIYFHIKSWKEVYVYIHLFQ